jgi:hypothetical protein
VHGAISLGGWPVWMMVNFMSSSMRRLTFDPRLCFRPGSRPQPQAACGGRCARVDPGHPVKARAVDRMNCAVGLPASGVSMITAGTTARGDLQPKNLVAPDQLRLIVLIIETLSHRGQAATGWLA